MKMKYCEIALLGLLSSVLLVACGGGAGGSATSAPAASSPAQGLWSGVTTTNRTVTNLVLGDGSYYMLYSPVSNPAAIAGVVQGTGSASSGVFASSNTNDYNLEGLGVNAATLSASYTAKQSFNGTVTYNAGGTSAFSATYDTSYDAVPSLAVLAGTFAGQVAALTGGIQNASMTVSSAGVLSGGGNGCAISGALSPRADGNAYNISITFGAAPCLFAAQTIGGVAYFNSATNELYVVAPNAARTDGIIFVGSGTAAAPASTAAPVPVAITPAATSSVAAAPAITGSCLVQVPTALNSTATVQFLSGGVTYTGTSTVSKLNGSAVSITDSFSGTTIDHIMSCNQDAQVKLVSASSTTSYSPQSNTLPSSLVAGFTENFSYTDVITTAFNTCTGTKTGSFTVVGTETVTVPAGTFNNAIRVLRTDAPFTASCSPAGSISGIGSTSTTWYVPGVGTVKSADATGAVMFELVSYSGWK